MTDGTNAPAGWYDDGRGQRRYWDGTQWTDHTAPLASAGAYRPGGAPADQAATLPYETERTTDPYAATTPYSMAPGAVSGTGATGVSAAGGATAYGAAGPYAVAGGPGAYGTPTGGPGAPGTGSGRLNVLGVVALALAVIGFILACIPFVQFVAWIVLPIAFVLSLVALFLEGRKWPAIAGLVVSVLGGIVGAVVFAFVTIGVLGELADSGVIQDRIERELEEEFGTPVPTEEATDGPDADATAGLAFGDTMTWDDGVSMTVSAPEPYTPSELSAGADQAVDLVFTLTITNDSPENVQPVVLSTLSSDGTEATRIFDVGAEGGQVGIPPTTAILPGESITWREAWSVADESSLTMQTSPSFEYESVVFTSVPQ
ncbi:MULTISPECIES: DUF2510 domain-containing protein [unclassified Agromyces]|uniref:DUF2510 domain-containing protein n=1 Tax=unclassified Agromyces TaxID=2639701 RepID=UPI00301422CE